MRMVLPLVLIGLAACYSPRSIGGGAYPAGPYGESYQEPLRATLWLDPHASHFSFDLNRPAHVAIFVWQPGGLLEMVQPAIGAANSRQMYSAGRHTSWNRAGQHFATRRVQYARFVTGMSIPRAGPIYYMLIASTEPLHVAPFFGHARTGWAHQVSWSNNLYTATELLASQIVPDPENTEWTVAYHVAWQDDDRVLYVPEASAYVWINCPGGVTLAVPRDVWARGLVTCPAVQPVEPPGDTATTRPGTRPERVPTRPELPGTTQADEADDAEFQRLLRDIYDARGVTDDEVAPRPVPVWRRAAQDTRPAAPMVRATRPDTRPAVAEPALPDARPTPASPHAQTRPSPRAQPSATGTERAPSPQVQRPTRDRQQPTRVDRPAPRVERPAPQPQRERPAPPPPPDG